MIHHPNTKPASPAAKAEPKAVRNDWQLELGDLLARAASLSAEHGVDVDTFMRSAWSAYIETTPGMREYLEEMQLRSQLEEIRKAGRMGEA